MEPRPGYFRVRVDVRGTLLRSLGPSEPRIPEMRSRQQQCSATLDVGDTPGLFEVPNGVQLGFAGHEGMTLDDARALAGHPTLAEKMSTFMVPDAPHELTDELWSILGRCRAVHTLLADGEPQLLGRGLVALRGLRFLVWRGEVDLPSMREVTTRCPLEELCLWDVPALDDALFARLGRSRTLRQLDVIDGGTITDDALDGLLALERLDWLSVIGQRELTTDAAVRLVRAVPIDWIGFYDCPGIELGPVREAASSSRFVGVNEHHTEKPETYWNVDSPD